MALIKKLVKIGNSWGVILPSDIMEVAGIGKDTEIEISVKGKGIILRPNFKTNKKDQKVVKAMAKFMKKYRDDLQRLA